MRSSSLGYKTLALKGISHLHGKSSCQWSQGSWLSMDIDARRMDVLTILLPGRLWVIIVVPTIFSYRFMLVVNHVKCNAFSERSGTPRILVSTTRIWSLKVTCRGSLWRSKYMNRYRPTNVPYRKWHQIHPFGSWVHGWEFLVGTSWLLTTSFRQIRRWTTSSKQACSRTRSAGNLIWIACPWWCEYIWRMRKPWLVVCHIILGGWSFLLKIPPSPQWGSTIFGCHPQ
jgi:hypothetical protein